MKNTIILALLLISNFAFCQTTSNALKSQIDTDITNKTGSGSISKTNVGGNMKSIVDYIDQQVSYKMYKAKLSQSGSSNITASVLKNDTGQTITYTRNSIGSYSINFSSILLDLNKVDIIINFQQGSFQCPISNIDNINVLASVETRYWNGTNFVLSDDLLNKSTLYIIINN